MTHEPYERADDLPERERGDRDSAIREPELGTAPEPELERLDLTADEPPDDTAARYSYEHEDE